MCRHTEEMLVFHTGVGRFRILRGQGLDFFFFLGGGGGGGGAGIGGGGAKFPAGT